MKLDELTFEAVGTGFMTNVFQQSVPCLLTCIGESFFFQLAMQMQWCYVVLNFSATKRLRNSVIKYIRLLNTCP